jgi:hypothetical protein
MAPDDHICIFLNSLVVGVKGDAEAHLFEEGNQVFVVVRYTFLLPNIRGNNLRRASYLKFLEGGP